MTEAVNSAVGRRLRNIREMLEVKVMDMADSLEISVGYYRKLERGDHAIRLPLLILLHEIYGIDLNYLITDLIRSFKEHDTYDKTYMAHIQEGREHGDKEYC